MPNDTVRASAIALPNACPPPLVPAEVDLRDFHYMPLDVVRLRDSDLAARSTGEEFRAAVMLWCAAWHQRPAASLPDDDVILANLAGYGRAVDAWLGVKDGALRNWKKCSDGRLYHPTVAEKANEAWGQKLVALWRRECDRARKENIARAKMGLAPMEIPPRPGATPSETALSAIGIPAENALNLTEQTGTEQNERNLGEHATPAGDRFAQFWEAYPHKVSQLAAERAFAPFVDEIDAILAGIEVYRRTKPADRHWLDPARFLADRRWTDRPAAPRLAPVASGPRAHVPGKVYVKRDTLKGQALQRARSRPWDASGGWWFDPAEIAAFVITAAA
jgi:hypothetical protein